MNFNFLSPVQDVVLHHLTKHTDKTLGHKLKIHTKNNGIPNLNTITIAIIGVFDNRNDINYVGENYNLNEIRLKLYNLFPGNWHLSIADLGDIQNGNTVEDTYFAVKETTNTLIQNNIIPLIIGGSQDITYAYYRAYDNLLPMVNIANVDCNFDLGDTTKPIKNNNFLGKIILEQPYNLFNYTTIGYQSYFNAQEEIDLMDKLYFEAYRLGDINANIKHVEPLMRDANIVTVDLKSIKSAELSDKQKYSPNGFSGNEICAISRYAGISNKVSAFGIHEYKPSNNDDETAMLVAQIIWYFIEGVNYRIEDDKFTNDDDYQKYIVLVDEQELIFYKSKKTGRWWVEISFLKNINNKLKKHTLLPCTHQDYIDATNNNIPKRWYKAYKKNNS